MEMEPLIKKSGEYLVRLRLSFTTNGEKRCVTTPTFGAREAIEKQDPKRGRGNMK